MGEGQREKMHEVGEQARSARQTAAMIKDLPCPILSIRCGRLAGASDSERLGASAQDASRLEGRNTLQHRVLATLREASCLGNASRREASCLGVLSRRGSVGIGGRCSRGLRLDSYLGLRCYLSRTSVPPRLLATAHARAALACSAPPPPTLPSASIGFGCEGGNFARSLPIFGISIKLVRV